ncbi:MAG: LptF/LptG family permease [Paludibacteraceae bacterium]|nr:LptF/LptG family permease [Paludibacteraceae bacterium]
MVGTQRIDRYLLRQFVGIFFATFFISSFILLMQFLWKHVNDVIGKGLDTSVIIEFFFYSSLTVIPLALPLAILLASLMTFGNLGEKFELTAMKAAGISLFRIMAPLALFISLLSMGAFFFSNNVLPLSQQRLWTLIYSLRQTSPELEIPTGEFYTGISGYNIYVREKDKEHKLLKEVMVYNFSDGFNNASVTTADSARMQMSSDKTYLVVTLYNGESFENLRDASKPNTGIHTGANVPYRRESFVRKQFVIDFNTNFARMDEEVMKDDYMSKDISRLQRTIDSLETVIARQEREYTEGYTPSHFFDRRHFPGRFVPAEKISEAQRKRIESCEALLSSLNPTEKKNIRSWAKTEAKIDRDEINNQKMFIASERYIMTRHRIEWHRKFTLSFACLVFFFIGAPLGAIIRKGGLGMPVVISVAFFIVYYIIDNTGYKMSRDGHWEAWQGIWLSSACILPIGIFFTFKAAKDSPVFNSEAYIILIEKIKKRLPKRKKQPEA